MPKVEYIVTCCSESWQSSRFEMGFIDHLQVVTTNNYNNIGNFHTLQITTAHAKSFQYAMFAPVIPW
jgi:hypothetical protein